MSISEWANTYTPKDLTPPTNFTVPPYILADPIMQETFPDDAPRHPSLTHYAALAEALGGRMWLVYGRHLADLRLATPSLSCAVRHAMDLSREGGQVSTPLVTHVQAYLQTGYAHQVVACPEPLRRKHFPGCANESNPNWCDCGEFARHILIRSRLNEEWYRMQMEHVTHAFATSVEELCWEQMVGEGVITTPKQVPDPVQVVKRPDVLARERQK